MVKNGRLACTAVGVHPVTRQEAAAFRKVPINRRVDLLSTAAAARLRSRTYDLFRLCTLVPQGRSAAATAGRSADPACADELIN